MIKEDIGVEINSVLRKYNTDKFLNFVVVSPEYQNKGIAKLLMNALLKDEKILKF